MGVRQHTCEPGQLGQSFVRVGEPLLLLPPASLRPPLLLLPTPPLPLPLLLADLPPLLLDVPPLLAVPLLVPELLPLLAVPLLPKGPPAPLPLPLVPSMPASSPAVLMPLPHAEARATLSDAIPRRCPRFITGSPFSPLGRALGRQRPAGS